MTPGPLDAASIEERLTALRETVRTWDWRAAVLDAPPTHIEDTTPVDPMADAAAPTGVHEESASASAASIAQREDHENPVTTEGAPVLIDEVAIRQEEISPVSAEAYATAPAVSPPLTDETQPVPVTTGTLAAPERPDGDSGDFLDTPVETPSESTRASDGPLARLWAHPRTKLAALCLVAVLAVLVIIGGLRLAHKDPGSGSGPTPTTVTTTTQHAATTTTTQPAVAPPVTAAQLAQYKPYAATFETADATAKTSLASAGSSPTLAQVAPIAASYLNALKLYNLQVHYVQWPTSMQTDVATDEAQLGAEMNLVQSVSSVSPADVKTWLSQLHAQSATLQTADNKIHQDLGLPASSSFP
jgi:hypothetical protein